MKLFLFCSLIFSQLLMAQDFKLGQNSSYFKTINNFTTPSFAGPSTLDQLPLPLGAGRQVLDETNTAPTPIPEDTSLIFRPTTNSFRQAQEERPLNSNTIRDDTEIIPGDIKKEDRGGQKGDMNYYP
jgi:hypothetical protein